MPNTIDISNIEDWDELDDYEQAELVAAIRKKGGNITGLDPKLLSQLSRLGGYPELPDIRENRVEKQNVYGPTGVTPVLQLGPAQKAAQADISRIAENAPRTLNPMDWITSGGKSPIPALVEGGANFLAGAKDELLQGKPGPWQQRLLAALARGGLNVAAGGAMNAATGREPEAGSAHNIANIVTPALPGAKGVGLNALSTGAAEMADTGSVGAGVGAAALSGGIGGALKGGQAAIRAGTVNPKARQDLAVELAKRIPRPVTPQQNSAQIVSKNAQDLANLSPEVLRQIRNYAPKSPIDPSAPNKAFDEIISRTNFDIRAMNKKEWDLVKKVAKEQPDQMYDRVIAPIFDAANYSDLQQAAKKFNKNVSDVATIAGKDRAAVLKDIRAKFVARLFEENDVAGTGQIVNPDSLRYRVESIGPDMFNQIFSDSPSTKSQASGAYDAFKTVIDLAEKGSRTNLTHDVKVFLTQRGPIWLRKATDSLMDFPLGSDKPSPLTHSKGAMAALGATGLISGKAAAAYAGLEIAEYTWDTFFDKFAKKNSRLMPILRSLSEPSQNYSATSIDRAIQTMFDAADTK